MHDSLTIALLQTRKAAMVYLRPIVKRYNLTEQQWRIMRTLAEHPSMDFHDLVFRACILRPSLTGILTRMERDGLMLRLKPVNDQCKLYASPTPVGTTLYESAQTEVGEIYCLPGAQFTTGKLQQLTSLLEEFTVLGAPAGRGDEEEQRSRLGTRPGEGNKRSRAGGGQRFSWPRQRPAVQSAGAGGAGTPLTGAHSAALGQFDLRPASGGRHTAVAYILAATQQALQRCGVLQRFHQSEGTVDYFGETLPAGVAGK